VGVGKKCDVVIGVTYIFLTVLFRELPGLQPMGEDSQMQTKEIYFYSKTNRLVHSSFIQKSATA
jgi:hypothetical protein